MKIEPTKIRCFPEVLKKLLQRDNLTQKELSKRVGVSEKLVDAWIHGRSNPSLEHLCKLSQCFAVSTDYLLGLPIMTEVSEKYYQEFFRDMSTVALLFGWLNFQDLSSAMCDEFHRRIALKYCGVSEGIRDCATCEHIFTGLCPAVNLKCDLCFDCDSDLADFIREKCGFDPKSHNCAICSRRTDGTCPLNESCKTELC